VLAFVALLWLVQAAATFGQWNLSALGVRPREPAGLIGTVTAPLVHGSWRHLFGNTLPLIVLGTAVLYGTPRAAGILLPVVWLGSGAAVWLFARPAVHLGASGLAYGMLLFVFVAGIRRRDRRSVALALMTFFLYGSMVWGVLPLARGISFEYHLAGAVIGIACGLGLYRRDPLPARRRYSWEVEEEEDATEPNDAPADLFFSDPRPDAEEESRRHS